MQQIKILQLHWLSAAILGGAGLVGAQTPAPPPAKPVLAPVAVATPDAQAKPQFGRVGTTNVVTVVRRLSSAQVLQLVERNLQNGEKVVSADKLKTTTPIVTNVVAGIISEDGKRVIALLPPFETFARVSESPVSAQTDGFFTSSSSLNDVAGTRAADQTGTTNSANLKRKSPASSVGYSLFENSARAQWQVITGDGKLFSARAVSTDARTGLTLLELDKNAPAAALTPPVPVATPNAQPINTSEELREGGRIYLLAPAPLTDSVAPADSTPVSAARTLNFRLQRAPAVIGRMAQMPGGEILLATINGANLTSAFNGGVAVGADNRVLGIFARAHDNSGRLLTLAQIEKVLTRMRDARAVTLTRAFFGVRGTDMRSVDAARLRAEGWDQSAAAALLAQSQRGILLAGIVPDSPAARAGLQRGDILIGFSNLQINGAEDFSFFVNQSESGKTYQFSVLRRAAHATAITPPAVQGFTPQLFEIQPTIAPAAIGYEYSFTTEAANSIAALGATLRPLTKNAAALLGARYGAQIQRLANESILARAGLRVGDVIEEIDGQPFDLSALEKNGAIDSKPKTLTVVRQKRRLNLSVQF